MKIEEAVIFMRQGKKIRHTSWSKGVYIFKDGENLSETCEPCTTLNGEYFFDDNWKVFEEILPATIKVKKYQVLFKFYSHDTGETEYAASQFHYKDEDDFNMHHDPYTGFPERGSVEFDSLILSSEKYE